MDFSRQFVFGWCVLSQTFTDGRLAPVPLDATDALGGSGHGQEARVTDVHGDGARRRRGELDVGVLHLRRLPTAQLWTQNTRLHGNTGAQTRPGSLFSSR